MRIAVLSDIHAVSATLQAALDAARREGFDILLILGDLLTYGIDPAETLAIVHDAVARDGAILVAGNHDQMYLDMTGAGGAYLAGSADWLREAVEWTIAQIGTGAMQHFEWRQSWSSGPLFAAHANPGIFGDWTYLADQHRAGAAASTLSERGYRYGVFGHTHRARRFDSAGVSIFTLGSLGQPRDDHDPQPTWTMIEVQRDDIVVQPHAVPLDRAAHRAAIRKTCLSPATQDRLCGFFT